MLTNILWTGREYNSMENCLIESLSNGANITSTVVGTYEGKIYKVEYHIKTNERREAVVLEINCLYSNQVQIIKFAGDGKGNWRHNGKKAEQFNGCIDVDIPLTPFTNTLPIWRLNLQKGETQEVQVIYFDLLEQVIKPVRQKYTCLSHTEYHYENIPNDFEADIRVDELGFVVDYPMLFERTAGVTL